jgi:histone deacetylase 6
MDVNVPAYVTQEEDMDSYIPRFAERSLESQMNELICYLWDNYIQLYEHADEIFLMGVGNAYLGIRMLLTRRGLRSSPSPEAPH